MSKNQDNENKRRPLQILTENFSWHSPVVLVALYIGAIIVIQIGLNYSHILQFLHARGAPESYLMLVSEILFLITGFVPLYVLAKLQKEKLGRYGLSKTGALRDTVIGFGLGFVLVLCTVCLLKLLGTYRCLGENHSANLALPLLICLVVGIAEELMFRGFIFNTIEKSWGTTRALVITSVLFGCAHLNNPIYSTSELIIGCLGLIFEAGLLLNAAFLINRSLWLAVGLHCAWDFFEGPFFGMAVSGVSLGEPYYDAVLVGDFAHTGGAFGPEASIPGVLCGTVFGAIFLYVAIKRRQWIAAGKGPKN